jgi:hypothetical protein
MEIYTDACGYGLGAVLSQRIEGKERPLSYTSRTLSVCENNYSTTEKECFALVWALKKFRPIAWQCEIRVITDHQALRWFMSKRELAERLARWSLSLQEWNLTIVYRSEKLHANADCLSRFPIGSEKPIEGDDLDETDRCLIAPIGLNTLSMELSTSDEIIRGRMALKSWGTVVKLLQRGKTSGRYQLVDGL